MDRPLVMGLGLGMGIQMGSDGKFYASMGGVTMPGDQHCGQEEQSPGCIEQAYGQKQPSSVKQSVGRGLSSSKELEDGRDMGGSLEQARTQDQPLSTQ